MAIFGKKKEKTAPGQEGSPTPENPPSGIPVRGGSVGGSGGYAAQQASGLPQGTKSPPTLGHASKGSFSNSAGYAAPNGSGIPQPQSILRSGNNNVGAGQQQTLANGAGMQAGQQAPGAASGFKFGGPPSQPQQQRNELNNGAPGSAQGSGPAMGSLRGAPPNAGADTTSQSPPYNSTATMVGGGGGGGPVSGLPPSSAGGLPVQSGPGGERPRTQQVVYPWSQRLLSMNPPRFLDEARQAAAVGAVSPSPFPRYGHAANSTASGSGEVYLFGGLVRESVKNDLYVVYVDRVTQPPGQVPPPGSQITNASVAGGVNATLVQTTGEIPPPRVGHATVLVANVLILWGGDTKVRADDKQDEGLYLLNLSTREWTRVRPANDGPNSGPVGRYGHTVAIVGSRFYVFGGQVDGTFMNDIWSFDLNSLKSTPTWELLTPSSDLPPRRTGHASVTHKDKIYIFGGTDGQYHYNDTWCYDVATNAWQELSCIGYIPVPREGHAACLVDDIMYIFGGRGVDGKDLGDLASFRIANQRWYMFANMGPSPSGRSGHALTAYQNKVVVLGGESFTGSKPDDPAIVYALDTGKIKYPPEGGSKQQTQSQQQQPTQGTTRKQAETGAGPMSPAERTVSPTQRGVTPMSKQADGPQNAVQSPTQGQTPQQQGQYAGQSAPQSELQNGQRTAAVAAVAAGAGAATMAGVGAGQSTSPLRNGPQQGQPTAAGVIASPQQSNVRGPAGAPASNAAPYNGPRSQRSLENMRNGGMSPVGRGMPPGAAGVLTDRTNNMSPTPQDGFHYSNLASPNGISNAGRAVAQPGEVDVLRKREAWMKAALALAVKKGFVAPEELDNIDPTSIGAAGTRSPELSLDNIDTGAPGSEKERIVRALVSLKAQLAHAKATIAQQAKSESDRIGESDRARLAALSEAAFYRAKLDALETGNVPEAERLQRDRGHDVERQLSESLRETGELEKQTARLREELKLEQQLRGSSDERLNESTKRAMAAEAAQLKVYEELSALQKRSHVQDAQLRDHREQVVSLSGLVARHKADHEEARGQLDEYRTSSDRHGAALRDLHGSLTTVTARAAEHERMHAQYRDLSQQHESTIARLRNELAAKSAEADGHATRAAELDGMVAHHRGEADNHRQAVTGGLAQVLAFHKQQQNSRSVESPIPSHVQDRLRSLQDESEGLRQMHTDSKRVADEAHAQLSDVRDRNLDLEKQQSGLRSELGAMRSQLAIALQEVARLKDTSGTRDAEVREAKRTTEAAQVKHALLRQFMTDHGVAVPGDDELNAMGSSGGVSQQRLRSLEEELDTQTRQLTETESRLRDASSHVEELQRELEHGSQRGAGGVDVEAAQRRASLAERELQEAHTSYRERTTQLENDYQTAVQFVKGSEKMLRRMKDELTKYKSDNSTMQNELMNARAGMYSTPDNEAAKDVEALRIRLADLTRQHDETTAENRELERKMAALISEHKEFRDKNREVLEAPAGGATQAAKAQELEGHIKSLEASLDDVRRELQESLNLNSHLSSELKAASGSKAGDVNGAAPSSSTLATSLNNAHAQNDQLRSERDALSQRLQETEDKLQLLLANDSDVGGEGATRDSHAFSITSELDKWERDRAGMPDILQAHGSLNTATATHSIGAAHPDA